MSSKDLGLNKINERAQRVLYLVIVWDRGADDLDELLVFDDSIRVDIGLSEYLIN